MVVVPSTLVGRMRVRKLNGTSWLHAATTNGWFQHWFYVKVDMLEVMGPMNAISTSTFNPKSSGFKTAEMKFYYACTFLGGRDVIEEYVGAKI
jgi:hypothetical protein